MELFNKRSQSWIPLPHTAIGPLRTQLLPMSEQATRRAGLREHVTASLAGQLTGHTTIDTARIENAVEEQALAVGRANISRTISDLVRYAGYAIKHINRGGRRHAVYLVAPLVLSALGKSVTVADTRLSQQSSKEICLWLEHESMIRATS